MLDIAVIRNLRTLAEAATPGPWHLDDIGIIMGRHDNIIVDRKGGKWDDLRYIAAAGPDDIIQMCVELEGLRNER